MRLRTAPFLCPTHLLIRLTSIVFPPLAPCGCYEQSAVLVDGKGEARLRTAPFLCPTHLLIRLTSTVFPPLAPCGCYEQSAVLVDGKGEARRLVAPGQLLEANLGLLGVVTEVTLQVVPARKVAVSELMADDGKMVTELRAIIESGEAVALQVSARKCVGVSGKWEAALDCVGLEGRYGLRGRWFWS